MAHRHVVGPAIKSWAGADEALRDIRQLEAAIATREGQKAVEAEARQRIWDMDIIPLVQKRDAMMAALEEFATMNRTDFAVERSRELNNGRIGFRFGQPALKTLKKLTWDKVLAILTEHRQKKFIAVKTTVNKEALLRSGLAAETLKGFGVEIVQEDRFFVELTKQETVAADSAA